MKPKELNQRYKLCKSTSNECFFCGKKKRVCARLTDKIYRMKLVEITTKAFWAMEWIMALNNDIDQRWSYMIHYGLFGYQKEIIIMLTKINSHKMILIHSEIGSCIYNTEIGLLVATITGLYDVRFVGILLSALCILHTKHKQYPTIKTRSLLQLDGCIHLPHLFVTFLSVFHSSHFLPKTRSLMSAVEQWKSSPNSFSPVFFSSVVKRLQWHFSVISHFWQTHKKVPSTK